MRLRTTGSSSLPPVTVEMPYALPNPLPPMNVPVRGLSSDGTIRRSAGALEVDVSGFQSARLVPPPALEHFRVWLQVTNQSLGGTGARAVARCRVTERTCSIPQWAMQMMPTGTGFLEISHNPNRPIRAPLVPIAAAEGASLTEAPEAWQFRPADVKFGYWQRRVFLFNPIQIVE